MANQFFRSTSAFLVFSSLLLAQDFRAKLAVTVRDSSSSSVPAAALELKDVKTSEVFPAATNDSGIYSYLFVLPGTYSLKVTAAGFKPAQRDGIVLQTYQATGIDVALEIGNVNESVTVTDEVALLDTESASRGNTLDFSRMAVYLGDNDARNFTNRSFPFAVPGDTSGLWNSLFVKSDNTITAISGTVVDGVRGIWVIDGKLIYPENQN